MFVLTAIAVLHTLVQHIADCLDAPPGTRTSAACSLPCFIYRYMYAPTVSLMMMPSNMRLGSLSEVSHDCVTIAVRTTLTSCRSNCSHHCGP
jgi:hypothetical protein